MPSKTEILLNNLRKLNRKNEQKIPTKSKTKIDLDDILLKYTKEAQMRIKHYLLPGFNVCQTPLADLSELQDYPNCVVSTPEPVHVEAKHCERVDMCHRRTLARATYRKRLLVGRSNYLNAMKKNKKLRALQKKGIYHGSLFDLAERLEQDPDPYFNDSYDYFYTGGNLCVLPEHSYVVHVGGDKLQDLYISRFSKKKDLPATPLRNLYIGRNACTSEIFEVRPFLNQRKNRTNCFVSRQRKFINLHAYRDEGKLKTLTQFKSDTTPFISFAQSEADYNQIAISNMKQHVRIYDLETGKPTLHKLYDLSAEKNVSEWNTIKTWRDHTYLYANTKELYLMDSRVASKVWRKNICSFGESEFFCQNICSLALSEFENLFYVGSSHKLYCLDARNWQSTFENKNTVCRWIHHLKYPPLLVETFRNDNSEFIALSSPVAGELHICELMRCGKVEKNDEDEQSNSMEYIYKSLSLAYQPPTLMEAYNSARLNGKCLRPDADLKQRLGCCTTGLTYYMNMRNKNAQALLLTSTSNGDVFGHKLSKRESQAHEPRTSFFTDEIVCKYEDRICELTPPTLNYTDIVDMKAMSKVFRCAALSDFKTDTNLNDESDDENKDVKIKLKKYRHFGRWQKPIKTLHSYKDVLAQDILSIWDIECDDLEDIKLSNLPESQRKKQKHSDIVHNWLHSNDAVPPMIKIPIDSFENSTANISNEAVKLNTSAMALEESFNMESFTTMADEVPQSTQLFENSTYQQLESIIKIEPTVLNTSLDTTAKSAIKKKKNKYVKGF